MRSVYRGMEYDDEFMIVFAQVGMLTSAGVIYRNLRLGLRFAGDFVLVATSSKVSPRTVVTSRSTSRRWSCRFALVVQAGMSNGSVLLYRL
jgi:hypothetical protein